MPSLGLTALARPTALPYRRRRPSRCGRRPFMTRLLTKIPAHRTGLTAGAVVCGHRRLAISAP
jgi:hypothetical protein